MLTCSVQTFALLGSLLGEAIRQISIVLQTIVSTWPQRASATLAWSRETCGKSSRGTSWNKFGVTDLLSVAGAAADAISLENTKRNQTLILRVLDSTRTPVHNHATEATM